MFDKKPKEYKVKKRISSMNSTGLTVCLHIKKERRSIFITLHKRQVQEDQIPQRKTQYTKFNSRENGE